VTGPVVQTAQGPVRGVITEAGVAIFRGVPFAQAARFVPPAPPPQRPEIHDASRIGPIAPQNAPEFNLSVPPPASEDCLNLNIFTPAADTGRRPVLVYIHAGAFVSGGGSGATQDGSRLAADEDVVVVSLNYRLGVLGFPPFKALGPEVSNNLGLLDQVEALRWTQANIAGFGGDPGNVTLFGYSAGGWSIAALMTLPLTAGLFHRAVVQSGSEFSASPLAEQADLTRRYLDLVDGAPTDPAALVDLPLQTLLDAQQALIEACQNDPVRRLHEGVVFGPRLDGVLFDDTPLSLLQQGQAHPVPLLIGSTEDELGYAPFRAGLDWLAALHTRAASLETLTAAFGPARAVAIWDAYAAGYPGEDDGALAGRIRSDRYYRLPAIRAAEAHATRAPTWMYRFDVQAASDLAGNTSTHATDLAFWLGTMAASPLQAFLFGGAPAEAEEALSRRMRADLAAFARDGTCAWPGYEGGRRATRIYDLVDQVRDDPAGEVRRAWD
jgi:para-nitrobenzyl esterase